MWDTKSRPPSLVRWSGGPWAGSACLRPSCRTTDHALWAEVTTGSRWTGGPRPSLGTSCSVSTGSPANSVDGQNCRSSGPLPADDVISCKFAIPHLAGHTPQPTPRRFPHASDPHTDHILAQPQSDYAPAETSVRLTRIKRQPAHSNPLGGMGTASLGDAATTTQWGPAFKPARRRAPAAQGVDPRGIWTGWTRQKSADAAPDRAGRMADHAGQARRHASAWVRSLHFSTLSRIS